MSRTIVLTEYVPSDPEQLTIAERDVLRGLVRDLTVQPVAGSSDRYTLKSSSTVGVVRVGELTVELRPKIGVAPVMFLVSYALDPKAWRDDHARIDAEPNLAEAIVPLFARTTQHALRHGLLHGYRSMDDTLTTIRGRIRTTDQFRRTGLPLPVDVAYDDFTPDILENRLLRTAVDVLGRLHLRDARSGASLARLHQQLDGIGTVEQRHPVPEPVWTRLNERYRPAVSLARLVLAGAGVEARTGAVDGAAFLVDMNKVFERFLRVALREALRLDATAFPESVGRRGLYLDRERFVPLLPDMTWWRSGRCVFVGDCKYKRPETTVPNADVYQMLAYLTRLGLDDGLLVYATDAMPHEVTLAQVPKRIRVRTIDVTTPPAQVLEQVRTIAGTVRTLATAPLPVA